jgi:hypothetical protein
LKSCAGGVHDQLWQKSLWKETAEIWRGGETKFRVRIASVTRLRRLTIPRIRARINAVIPSILFVLSRCGPVAQLGARFHGMEEVVGSIPTRSTKIFDVLVDSARRDSLPLSFHQSVDFTVLCE